MKNFLFTLLLAGCVCAVYGQQYSISGRVLDQAQQPLPDAHVQLLTPAGQPAYLAPTDNDGRFEIEQAKPGAYRIEVTFLGFNTYRNDIVLEKDTELGDIRLGESQVELGEVEVREQVPLATQKGDTTEYNARAFKTLPDANAENLVEKLPSVVVTDGKVQAQGEDVKQVLVDGKPFFGNDPTAALRNLPAEVIDKIQIFDQKSDQAQFTGFDDGQTNKTINIVTRKDMRNGQFGKVYGGYGTDERYQAGGTVNFFDGSRRISVIGQTNNVNQQNFAAEDLLGVVGSSGRRGFRGMGGGRGGGRSFGRGGSVSDFLVDQQGGISTTHAFGLNYSDQWGEKLDVAGSYFFNKSRNDARESLRREFVNSETSRELYSEDSESCTYNINHRFNMRLNYEIDSMNSIIMRPRLSLQYNDGTSSTFGETVLGETPISRTDNFFGSDLQALNFSNSVFLRHRFNKQRRTLSMGLHMGYNDQSGDSRLNSENEFFRSGMADSLDQNAALEGKGWNLTPFLMYTEPVGESSMLMINARASWQEDDSDKKTFDFSEQSQAYDQLNTRLSNVFENKYLTQEAGAGYNFRKGKSFFMLRGTMQRAELQSDETFPAASMVDRTYYSFLPMVMFRRGRSRDNSFMVFYRANTDNPSVDQLQNVLDNSNPLQLKIGNPALDQSVQHRIFMRYSNINTENSSVFFAMLSASLTDNYIANGVYLAESDHPVFDELGITDGAQLTRPVNLDGYRNLRSFVTFGLPVRTIKSNLNFNLSGDYTRIPGLINDDLNYSNNAGMGLGVVLSSNISDKVDFTISSQSNFNLVENSLQTAGNDNYFNQQTRVRLDWIFGPGFVFRTNVNHQYFDGLSEGFNDSYFLWNAAIGKKLFKNQLGEISLSVFDLLDQNTSISRNVTEVYIEDSQVEVLQRYVMVNFTYNIRHFYSKKSKENPPDDRFGNASRMRPPFAAPDAEEDQRRQQLQAMIDTVAGRLELNEAQKEQFKEVSERYREKMQDLRHQFMGDFTAMREGMQKLRAEQEAELKTFLSEEQFEKYQQLQREMRGRWRGN